MRRLLCILIIGLLLFSGCIKGPSEETTSIYETTSTVAKTTTTTIVQTTSTKTPTTSLQTCDPADCGLRNGVCIDGICIQITSTLPETTTSYEPSVREFNITAKRFSFNPSTVRVGEGDRVRLNIKSTDVTHGFSIYEYDINVDLPEGETKVVEFTAYKKGTFTYRCSVFCGGGHGGMKGTLIVE